MIWEILEPYISKQGMACLCQSDWIVHISQTVREQSSMTRVMNKNRTKQYIAQMRGHGAHAVHSRLSCGLKQRSMTRDPENCGLWCKFQRRIATRHTAGRSIMYHGVNHAVQVWWNGWISLVRWLLVSCILSTCVLCWHVLYIFLDAHYLGFTISSEPKNNLPLHPHAMHMHTGQGRYMNNNGGKAALGPPLAGSPQGAYILPSSPEH